MRGFPVLLALSLLVAASPAAALQKRSVTLADGAPPAWSRGLACDVSYYNLCTAWMWAWSEWDPGDRVGAAFDACNTELHTAWIRTAQGAPAGYGFTGTIAVHGVDDSECPTEESWNSEPFLPESDWNAVSMYSGAVSRFAIVVTLGPAPGNPVEFLTDHPAIGPTGPVACGTCYPADRATRSFWWGPESAPLCPGSPFFDGFCNAELLIRVDMGPPPLAVEDTSWGRLKALFR